MMKLKPIKSSFTIERPTNEAINKAYRRAIHNKERKAINNSIFAFDYIDGYSPFKSGIHSISISSTASKEEMEERLGHPFYNIGRQRDEFPDYWMDNYRYKSWLNWSHPDCFGHLKILLFSGPKTGYIAHTAKLYIISTPSDFLSQKRYTNILTKLAEAIGDHKVSSIEYFSDTFAQSIEDAKLISNHYARHLRIPYEKKSWTAKARDSEERSIQYRNAKIYEREDEPFEADIDLSEAINEAYPNDPESDEDLGIIMTLKKGENPSVVRIEYTVRRSSKATIKWLGINTIEDLINNPRTAELLDRFICFEEFKNSRDMRLKPHLPKPEEIEPGETLVNKIEALREALKAIGMRTDHIGDYLTSTRHLMMIKQRMIEVAE